MAADAAGSLDAGTLRGDAAEHALGAEHTGDHLLVAEAVLETDGNGVVAEHAGVERVAHGRRGARSLALHQHRVGGPAGGRVGGRRHVHPALAAMPDDAQAAVVDGVDVVAPDVDQGHVQAALRELTAEQRSHRAGPEDGHSRFHAPMIRLSIVHRVMRRSVQTRPSIDTVMFFGRRAGPPLSSLTDHPQATVALRSAHVTVAFRHQAASAYTAAVTLRHRGADQPFTSKLCDTRGSSDSGSPWNGSITRMPS